LGALKRPFSRTCALLLLWACAAAGAAALSGPAYCQEKPEAPDKPPAGEKDKPVVIPQSPEEKEALKQLESAKKEEDQLDEVVLADGTKIRGRVVDPGGPAVKVIRESGATHGSVSILKRDIKELHLRSDPGAEVLHEDVVHLAGGQEIRGCAQVSADGATVSVTMKKEGKEQTVAFPRSEVIRIEYAPSRDQAAKNAPVQLKDSLGEIIDKRLSELASADEEVSNAAAEKLVSLGVFAVGHLKEKLPKLEEAVARKVARIIEINEIKSYISAEAMKAFNKPGEKNIYERLTSTDADAKLATLQELSLIEEGEMAPLLCHLARQKKEAAEVRVYCLHMLAQAEHNNDLLELMTEDDGWLRLAAALHLADNGIYAGVPHFIAALNMSDEKYRKVAVEKLRQASGENFGFDPAGPEKERLAAIKKWEDWWSKNSDKVLRQSLKLISSKQIADDDRSFSRIYHKRAEEAWAAGKFEQALESFGKSVELDPSNLTARLSKAIMLYTELGKNKEAMSEISTILRRYSDELVPMIRKQALYHAAMISLSEGNWRDAIHDLQSAITLDERYTDGYIALGKTYYVQAVTDDMIARERLSLLPKDEREEFEQLRKEVIGKSVRSLEIGLSLLDEQVRLYANQDFLKMRREEESKVEERRGTKSEGPSRTEQESAVKEALSGRKAQVCDMLADSYSLQMEWRKAANCLSEAVKLSPENTQYLCKLGATLAASGDSKGAREAYQKCLELDPGNQKATEGLKNLK
jgi:tetratricopeptide (TPR) repeat protein